MSFYLSIGILFAAFSIMTVLLLREVSGRLVLKVACVTALVALSTYTTYTYRSVLGYPTFADLPKKARLLWIDIREVDDEDYYSIWLSISGDVPPRAYRIYPTEREKQALRSSKRDLMAGRIVLLENVGSGDGENGKEGRGGGQGRPGTNSGGSGPFVPNSGNGMILRMPTQEELTPPKGGG